MDPISSSFETTVAALTNAGDFSDSPLSSAMNSTVVETNNSGQGITFDQLILIKILVLCVLVFFNIYFFSPGIHQVPSEIANTSGEHQTTTRGQRLSEIQGKNSTVNRTQ